MASISVSRTSIDGLLLLEPPVFRDERGYFSEIYVRSKYRDLGISEEFVQDSISWSYKNVLRGMHGDRRMSKIVQVLYGEVVDVIADARRSSPSYGKWEPFDLSQANGRQLYVPAGCLHGFYVVSDVALMRYKQSAEYAKGQEIGVRWDDPDLAIAWPLSGPATLSAKDQANQRFRDL